MIGKFGLLKINKSQQHYFNFFLFGCVVQQMNSYGENEVKHNNFNQHNGHTVNQEHSPPDKSTKLCDASGSMVDGQHDREWDKKRIRAIEVRCQDKVWYASKNTDLFVEAKGRVDELLSTLVDKWVRSECCNHTNMMETKRQGPLSVRGCAKRNLWPRSPVGRPARGRRNTTMRGRKKET